MTRGYEWLLRSVRPRLDAAIRRDMTVTFDRVYCAAASRGRRAAIRTAAAEYLDLLAGPFRGDPLAPRPPNGQRRGPASVLPSWQDWRTAVRRLRTHPGYSIVVIGVLALVIAINTVVFSVADSAMFRGLPYPNAGRLHEVFASDERGRASNPGMAPEAFDEWRRHDEIFDAFEGFCGVNFIALGNGEPEQISGAQVTPGLFAALGVGPARGRLFDPRDGDADGNEVALISDALWHRRFGDAPDVEGRTLTLNDKPFTIVGVMPPHFRFPSAQFEVWVAASPRRMPRREPMALLKNGLRKETAQERLDTIAAALGQQRPQPDGWRIKLMPPRGTRLNPWTRSALQVLMMAVVAVLLIACANLANLGVAQSLARRHELAVRAALGASRWRLVRELSTEHLVLGAAGGFAGLVLAWWGVQLAVALAPANLTVWTANEIRIDTRILMFTALVTLGSALLFGIVPAWRASRADAGDALKTRTAAAAAHGRMRALLVVTEVALSVVLLTGAALLIRSFTTLTRLDPGFDPSGLTTLNLQVPTDRYPAAARRDYIERIAQAIRSIPGVTAVTASNGIPTEGGNIHFGELEVEGAAPSGNVVLPNALVDPAYLSTMNIRLLAGRGFTPEDDDTSALVSESLAQRMGGPAAAIGRRFRIAGFQRWWTVVGVTGEVRQSRDMEREGSFEMYTTLWRRVPAAAPSATARPAGGTTRSFAWMRMTIRAEAGAQVTATALKTAVWSIDSTQPVADIRPVDDVLALSLAQDRFGMVLMATFAGLALVLAAAGLFAVLAQLVAQRRQEIGIRMALGASVGDVARLIVGRGVSMTAAGIAIGLAGAWASARFLASQLYGVVPHDPISFAAVPLILFAVALLASWVPARRALAVDPIAVLRTE